MSFYSEKTNKFFFLTVTIIILLTAFQNSDARKRYYNKEKTRSEAIFILRTESAELSTLAGLTPLIDDSLTAAKKQEIIKSAEEILDNPSNYEGDMGEDISELESELENDDNFEVSLDVFEASWLDAVAFEEDDAFDMMDCGIMKYDMMAEIMKWLGTPYRYGGGTTRGIDCSAFTKTMYRNTGNIRLPRTARTQINIVPKEQRLSREELQFGDLIYFNTRRRPYVSHVGIYLGDSLFAHASSKYGVTFGSLEWKYYKKRFICGTRVTSAYAEKYAIVPAE